MTTLDEHRGMDGFSERYVQSKTEIDLAGIVRQFGLELVNDGSGHRIEVGRNLNVAQRQLLKSLGKK
jgi:hypothetical protein